MKTIATIALVVVGYLAGFSQTPVTLRADRDSVAEDQIKQLEFTLAALLEKRDIETYATYLTDDYIRIAANGIVSTKEQVLEGFRKSTTTGKMTPHDLNVRVYGNTAILRAILDIEDREGKKRTSIITKVFLRDNGRWYMASMQGTAREN